MSAAPISLPSEGEGLISVKTMAGAMGLSESYVWDKAAKDPTFPKLIRVGPRCTRLQLSAARKYIANLSNTEAKVAVKEAP